MSGLWTVLQPATEHHHTPVLWETYTGKVIQVLKCLSLSQSPLGNNVIFGFDLRDE